MNAARKSINPVSASVRAAGESAEAGTGPDRPLVSLVLPAFNEAVILERNLARLCDYMSGLEADYDWEVVVVNDGSRDETGVLAEAFAKTRENVRVFHHPTNFGLGQAFKSAFRHTRGDYVITLDVDLSYGPEHIGRLLEKIRATRAKMVLASPYMKGGTIANVPRLRRTLSIWANRFLSMFAHGQLSTLTCMVRAYDGHFVRSLNLRATGMEVMPEMIYKAMILRARIEQIPAHLDWGTQVGPIRRRSSIRIFRQIFSTLLSGFIFRPFMFFIAPGMLLLVFSLWVNTWMFIHFFEQYFESGLVIAPGSDRVSAAVAAAYAQYPHTFIVGLLSLMLAVQLIGLGVMALQSKNYFEEMFHLASGIFREQREDQRGSKGPV